MQTKLTISKKWYAGAQVGFQTNKPNLRHYFRNKQTTFKMFSEMEEVEALFALLMLLTASFFLLKRGRRRRRWDVKPINRDRNEKGIFNNLIKSMILQDHEGFFSYTRMTPKLFEILLSQVGPRLKKDPSKNPLPPVHRLLITLHYLSEGCSMKEIACGHYLGHATVSVIIRDTTKALWDVLAPHVLKVPSEEEWKEIAEGFFNRWNLPNCVGAIDGKHINIQAPKHSGTTFFNYRKHFSIVLMASCDAFYRFTLVDIGAAGGNHDGAVFSSSGFGHAILSKTLKIPAPKNLPNTHIKFSHFFIADAAFPLGENLMRPYPGEHLSINKRIFNYRLSRARRTIEHAFGILVNRWRILRRPLICDLETCEKIVQATVVLHNFVQRSELEIPEAERKYSLTGYKGNLQGESRGNNLRSVGRVGSNNFKKKDKDSRNTLCDYFMSPEGSVAWQMEKVERGVVPEGFMDVNLCVM